MLIFKKDEEIPKELKEFVDGKTDTLMLLAESPMLGLITLTDINKMESEAFLGDLEVGYAVIDKVPFLILNFNHELVFDVVIENLLVAQKEENALNLIFIENRGLKIVDMRLVGLDTSIIESLMRDTKNIPYSKEDLTKKAEEIKRQYSSLELLELSIIRQSFSK